METPNQPKRTIDERIDALTMNMELLETQVRETSRKVDQLTETVNKHEQDWDRFRRAMRAGLEEWLSDNGDGNEDAE